MERQGGGSAGEAGAVASLSVAAGPDYTVVVPAYNEADYLPGALRALREAMAQLPERRGEVLVVDNASTDDTAQLARAAGATVICEPHRQIARARNAGGRHARARHLIFVDADTRVSGALLRETLAVLEAGETCGGGTGFRFDSGPFWSHWLAGGWNRFSRLARWAAGSYFFCLREGFLATGGFDETVYASEEIGFSRTLKRWGRARGLRFRILREPVITSARKLRWFSGAQILRQALGLLIAPRRVRQREHCAIWYTRPEDARPRE